MEHRLLILKGGYVIDVVVIADGNDEYAYPRSHDKTVVDDECNVGIGDWYEESEGIFYRPLSNPPDRPTN